MRKLAEFSSEGFATEAYELIDKTCFVIADADVDDDGSGQSHGDPYHQGDTTLHHRDGTPLNADEEYYIVLPPSLIRAVAGIVLGCQAWVEWGDKRLPAVVGDVGPLRKIGELSYALARDLGINPNPNTGGVDDKEVLYQWSPGVPANVNGRLYDLQKS